MSVWIIYAICLVLFVIGARIFIYRDGGEQSKHLYRLKRLSDKIQYTNAKHPLSKIKEAVRKDKVNHEIFEAIGFTRNLIAAKKGIDISADHLLEQLSLEDGVLQPAYLKALSLLRVNKKVEMIDAFSEMAGTKFASDFIRIIIRWDTISPEKLASTLLSYQSAMKEINTTRLRKKAEILSDLVFLPVVANVVFIFINFIIVGYFLTQREFLEQVFF